MSLISKSLRSAVVARAENRCEYCHLPTVGQVATFPIDHVTPRILDGKTVLENAALACPRCNGSKWKHIEGAVSASGEIVPLFNPRISGLVGAFPLVPGRNWHAHWLDHLRLGDN